MLTTTTTNTNTNAHVMTSLVQGTRINTTITEARMTEISTLIAILAHSGRLLSMETTYLDLLDLLGEHDAAVNHDALAVEVEESLLFAVVELTLPTARAGGFLLLRGSR